MKALKTLLIALAITFAAPALSQSAEDLNREIVVDAIDETRAFLAEHPIVEPPVDVLGVVDLWQRVESLKGMIFLHQYGDLPPEWLPELHKRIDSHHMAIARSASKRVDSEVSLLANLVQLHAEIAASYMRGDLAYRDYRTVVSSVLGGGTRELAERVQDKHGDGRTVLEPEPEINWGN